MGWLSFYALLTIRPGKLVWIIAYPRSASDELGLGLPWPPSENTDERS
jgi:hypothetical protein